MTEFGNVRWKLQYFAISLPIYNLQTKFPLIDICVYTNSWLFAEHHYISSSLQQTNPSVLWYTVIWLVIWRTVLFWNFPWLCNNNSSSFNQLFIVLVDALVLGAFYHSVFISLDVVHLIFLHIAYFQQSTILMWLCSLWSNKKGAVFHAFKLYDSTSFLETFEIVLDCGTEDFFVTFVCEFPCFSDSLSGFQIQLSDKGHFIHWFEMCKEKQCQMYLYPSQVRIA